jgi:hypothetical protein
MTASRPQTIAVLRHRATEFCRFAEETRDDIVYQELLNLVVMYYQAVEKMERVEARR